MIKDSQIFFESGLTKKSQISQQRKATGYLPSASSAPDTQSPTRPHGTLVRQQGCNPLGKDGDRFFGNLHWAWGFSVFFDV